MLLTDDNFCAIAAAVGEGEIIYKNLINAMRFFACEWWQMTIY